MADFIQSYKAKGVLSVIDKELVETKKEGIQVHDLESALRRFDGQEVVISITVKEEVEPKSSEAQGE